MLIWNQPSVLRNAPDSDTGGAPADPPADPPAEPAASSEPDFDWVPEAYRSDDGYDFTRLRADFDEAQAQLAIAREAEEAVPESPDAYELSLPDDLDMGDLEVPEWFASEIDMDNPALGDLRNWMHQHKLPATAGKDLLGMFARAEAAQAVAYQQQAQAEIQALGPQAESRLSRIQRSLETRIPNEGQRQAILDMAVSADAVKALEVLLSGTSAKSSAGRAAGGIDPNLRGMDALIAAREAV